jgi:hypothetical protein
LPGTACSGVELGGVDFGVFRAGRRALCCSGKPHVYTAPGKGRRCRASLHSVGLAIGRCWLELEHGQEW